VNTACDTPELLRQFPDLRQITRYCTATEISTFLRSITALLEQDRQRMAGWDRRLSELDESITSSPYQELKAIHDELNQIELERFLVTFSVSALHHSCTHYRDVLAKRAMVLVEAEMEAAGRKTPDLPFALISMGSDGREEQTLITDQDYLIVYGDGEGADTDQYFLDFSTLLVDRMEQAGFKRCTGDIMPSNQAWRGSLSQWHKRLMSIVRYETEDYARNMMDLIVLSDARYVAGDRALGEDLVGTIRNMEREYSRVLWGMAKAATELKLALGFMKRLWTESSGEHKGELNLKLLAWVPLVMCVRVLSINKGIPASNTVERITLLEKEGSLSASMASDLRAAYHVLTKHRILLQIKVIKGIQTDSHHLNPYELPSEERERIRHALIRIDELQKMIHSNFSIV
jgi:signal-transduction protein with cAMP-binding, CBS, and nucleotidyltransferase domain